MKPRYLLTDALNDLAALLSNRWVGLPLILLLSLRVAQIDPATLYYLVPLLLLTVLVSIRATAILALRELVKPHKAQDPRRYSRDDH